MTNFCWKFSSSSILFLEKLLYERFAIYNTKSYFRIEIKALKKLLKNVHFNRAPDDIIFISFVMNVSEDFPLHFFL